MRDILVLDKPHDIKLIFSKKHNMILKLVIEKELSISDIARSLDINPGSVHYHLKELERHGLVKQVREEIKGGIIKKYYRSAAKRILLDSPDFNKIAPDDALLSELSEEFTDRIIRSIEYLGYGLPPENREDAKDLLLRLERRMMDISKEIHGSGLESVESDGMLVRNVCQMVLIIRAKDDPELDRVYREFGKLFEPYE